MAISLKDFLLTFDRTSIASERAAAVAKRTTLVHQFPVDGWSTLPLERYALGTPKSEDSFCYQMEYVSYELGSIAGGSADKHLIYWHRKTNAWKFESRYANAEQAWGCRAVPRGISEGVRLCSLRLVVAIRGRRAG